MTKVEFYRFPGTKCSGLPINSDLLEILCHLYIFPSKLPKMSYECSLIEGISGGVEFNATMISLQKQNPRSMPLGVYNPKCKWI